MDEYATMAVMTQHTFSNELKAWLKGTDKKTLGSLEKVFQERSFAIIILLLMALPALPLPTGGVTHVFEVIVMLISLEMLAGLKTIWLPNRWRKKELGSTVKGKFVPYLIRRIHWFEKYSKPRLREMIEHPYFNRLAGFLVFVFALSALLAPPFSGLDTLPALGAVIIALSLILGDFALFIVGNAIGIVGVSLVIVFGSVTISIIKHFI